MTSPPETQHWQPRLIEAVATLTTMAAVAVIFLNYVGAHLTFFGEPVDIVPEAVRTYWIAVAALSASLVAAFGAALRRGARKSFAWHGLMTVIGLVVSLAFAVTTPGPPAPSEPERDPEPRPSGSVCRSGGDSDECLGG